MRRGNLGVVVALLSALSEMRSSDGFLKEQDDTVSHAGSFHGDGSAPDDGLRDRNWTDRHATE